ncbi:MAG: hypothetical protein WCP70_10465 [Methanothrix sp.]
MNFIKTKISEGLSHLPRFKVANLLTDPMVYNYKIALIPLRLDIDQFEHETSETTNYKILKIKEKYSKDIQNQIVFISKEAAKAGAKLIIFGELSYPIIEDETLSMELYNICRRYDCIIIPGSYHELRMRDFGLNKSPIFTPYSHKPFTQVKNSRGFYIGEPEETRILSSKEISLFKSKYGTFIVTLGTDIIDSNLNWNVRVLNEPDNIYTSIDLIIVPCFTDKPAEFIHWCKDLSLATMSYVIFINSIKMKNYSAVFINGKKSQSWAIEDSMLDDTPIKFYDIDLINLYRLRASKKLTRRSRFFHSEITKNIEDMNNYG